MQPSAANGPAKGGMFRSLRHVDFRLLLAGQMLASSGLWMEQVSRGWLVYDLTGSPLLLGLVQATRALPMLIFGLVAGVVADRYDRKRQIILAQNVNVVVNLGLAALILTGRVETWHIFVTAFLAGSAMAFQMPARQSLLPALVTREDLTNAIAINSAVLNSTRTIGPAVAGLLVAVVGVGWSYVVQAVVYLLASLWTRQIDPSRLGRTVRRQKESWGESIMGGFGYVRSNPTVFGLLLLALIPVLLAQPYQALAPVFARDIFMTGATGQGILLAVPGVGSVVGAGMVARMANAEGARAQLVGGVIVFGLALIAFALSPWYVGALAALFVVGVASTSYRAVNQTMLQMYTEDRYLGRVMSMYFLETGMAPAGSLLIGALAATLGAPDAVAIMGALTAAFAVAMFIAVAPIRALGQGAVAPRGEPRLAAALDGEDDIS